MKQKYEMTEEEYQVLLNALFGINAQRKTDIIWNLLALKYGFVRDTVEQYTQSKIFLATPKGES